MFLYVLSFYEALKKFETKRLNVVTKLGFQLILTVLESPNI